MWHEARKQERKIRGMLVDYRRRAERRQDFYEKIKADPTQFMQIHGRKCRIHLDPAIALLGDGGAIIVPWQGQKDNLIDRFDVRAHLDFIPPIIKSKELDEITAEERQCNYERYRILAQNDFLCLSEDKFLHQLFLEEQFGCNAQFEIEQRTTNKKPSNAGAAIAYTYEDSEPTASFNRIGNTASATTVASQTGNFSACDNEDESDSDIDMDVSIEINKLDNSQAHDLNSCGRNYGMMSNDFFSFLVKDADEADALRIAREEEQEKIMLSGRKSRRERRAQRERRCAGRPLSPPSYAAKEDPIKNQRENESDSRSPSPENSGKITYITSFGGEEELQHSKISMNLNKSQKSNLDIDQRNKIGFGSSMSYADKVKENLVKLKHINETNRNYRRKSSDSPKKPKQYIRSCSRSRYRRRRSRSYSRSRRSSSCDFYKRSSYRDRRFGRGRSRSKSRRDRSKSRSNKYVSRSRSPNKSVYVSHYRRYSSSSNSSLAERKKYTQSKLSRSPFENKSSESKYCRSKSKTKKITLSNLECGESIVPKNIIIPIKKIVQQSQIPFIKANSSSKNVIPLTITVLPEGPSFPVKRYYGRKRENESQSSSSNESGENENNEDTNENSNSNTFSTGSCVTFKNNAVQRTICNNSISSGTNLEDLGPSIIGSSLTNFGKSSINPITSVSESKINIRNSTTTANLRDRLKRKMQILLNKQYKADKKAEIERIERQIQQQNEREDEMRELALKLRRRQRELRHKYGSPTSSENDESAEININNSPLADKKGLVDSNCGSKSELFLSSSLSSSSSSPNRNLLKEKLQLKRKHSNDSSHQAYNNRERDVGSSRYRKSYNSSSSHCNRRNRGKSIERRNRSRSREKKHSSGYKFDR